MCMWKLEVDVGCLPGSLSTYILRQDPLFNHSLVHLTNWVVPELSSLSTPCWDYHPSFPFLPPSFSKGAGIWTLVLTLAQQALHLLNHLPSLELPISRTGVTELCPRYLATGHEGWSLTKVSHICLSICSDPGLPKAPYVMMAALPLCLIKKSIPSRWESMLDVIVIIRPAESSGPMAWCYSIWWGFGYHPRILSSGDPHSLFPQKPGEFPKQLWVSIYFT
jgi:hypothetical protein